MLAGDFNKGMLETDSLMTNMTEAGLSHIHPVQNNPDTFFLQSSTHDYSSKMDHLLVSVSIAQCCWTYVPLQLPCALPAIVCQTTWQSRTKYRSPLFSCCHGMSRLMRLGPRSNISASLSAGASWPKHELPSMRNFLLPVT